MHLTAFAYALWAVTTFLEGALCVLAVQRRSYRQLPIFTAYAGLLFVRTLILWYVYYHLGFNSKVAAYFSWITGYLLIAARTAVCVELSRAMLAAYRGLWLFARMALIAIGIAIIAYATVDAFKKAALALENSLELGIAAILLFCLLTSVRYRILVDSAPRLIAVGLCFYSLVQVLNNGFVAFWLGRYFSWWGNVRALSFQVALVLCIFALRKPSPEMVPSPTSLPQTMYENLADPATRGLRQLDHYVRGMPRR